MNDAKYFSEKEKQDPHSKVFTVICFCPGNLDSINVCRQISKVFRILFGSCHAALFIKNDNLLTKAEDLDEDQLVAPGIAGATGGLESNCYWRSIGQRLHKTEGSGVILFLRQRFFFLPGLLYQWSKYNLLNSYLL